MSTRTLPSVYAVGGCVPFPHPWQPRAGWDTYEELRADVLQRDIFIYISDGVAVPDEANLKLNWVIIAVKRNPRRGIPNRIR